MSEQPENKVENTEEPKLEWSADRKFFGYRDGVQEEVNELNKNLAKGEKPWRLPTEKEIVEISKNNPDNFNSVSYWCSSEDPVGKPILMTFNLDRRDLKMGDDARGWVRCVR